MTATNPIHKSLASLLPGLNPVPPRLLAATESLISLSRQRASNLKTEEEIARSHACAELACKKLRVSLRLPNVKSGAGAPCRPAIYKRLLTFLDNTLADVDVVGTPGGRKAVKTPTRTPTTGKRKRDAEAEHNEGNREMETEIDTPSKRARSTPRSKPRAVSSTQKKKDGFLGRIESSASKKSNGPEAPDYVLSSIRTMCRTFKTPTMTPHVYTGVCVIMALAGQWPRSDHDQNLQDEVTKEKDRRNILNGMIAVYLLTLTRMQEGLMTTELYQVVLGRSIEVLGLQEREKQITESIEDWIGKIQENAWTTEAGGGAHWWDSVPENVIEPLDVNQDVGSDSVVEDAANNTDDEDELGSPTPTARRKRNNELSGWEARRAELRKQLEQDDPEDVLLPGLGTMMNDAVDFLSEEKLAEFEHWKTGIMKQIATIEKNWAQKGGGTAVAVQ